MSVSILFQNQDFAAVDKAAGVSVHNVEDAENLLGLLEKQFGKRKIFPVHRLDKETSGVQLVAFTDTCARELAELFQTRAVQKTYVGLLRGEMKDASGVWNQPLSDKAEGRKLPEGLNRDRVPCETRYRVLERSKYFSLCEFDLITGRQHQIRKHSALNRHGLVGDARYGDPRYNRKIAELYKIERMLLHCAKVELAGHSFASPAPDWNRLCRPPESVGN